MRYLSLITLLLCGLLGSANAQNIEISGTIKKPGDSIISFFPVNPDPIVTYFKFEQYTASIKPDGNFNISLPASNICKWTIQVKPDQFWQIDLSPGSHLHLDLPAKSQLYNYTVTGDHADDVLYQQQLWKDTTYIVHYLTKDISVDSAKKDPAGTRAKHKREADYASAFLDRYAQTHQVSAAYYKYKKLQYSFLPYTGLYNDLMMQTDSSNAHYVFDGILDNDSAAGLLYDYTNLVQDYVRSKMPASPQKEWAKTALSIGDTALRGRTRQLLLTSYLCYGTVPFFMDTSYTLYFNKVTDPVFVGLLHKKRAQYQAMNDKYRSSKEDSSKAASINDILAKYKGKVVFVDFWASWCGPCRMEMPSAKKLEERYKNKDVVFVYFAVSDTKQAWLNARDEIKVPGEHYLLGKNLGHESKEVWGVKGIPLYAIVDKEGKIVNGNAPRPSQEDQLYTLIDAALAK